MEFLRRRRRAFVILTPTILGVVFIVLCLMGLQHSVNPAEARTVFVTRFDFGQIWDIAGSQGEGPLYYWLAKTWAHFCGHADYVLRVLSALLGAATIMFTFLWLKYKYGLRAAVLSASFMTIAPLFVHFGQSAEAMTLILALTAAANYFLQIAIDHGGRTWWILYATTMILGCWTSGFLVLVLAAHVVYLWRTGGKELLRCKEFVAALIAIVIGGGLMLLNHRRMLVMNTEADLYNSLSNATLYMSGVVPTLIALAILALVAYGAYKYRLRMLGYIAITTWLGALLLPWLDLNTLPFLAVIPCLCVGIVTSKLFRETYPKQILASGITVGAIAMCVVGLVSVFQNLEQNVNTGDYYAGRRIINNVLEVGANEKLAIVTDDEELYFQLAAYTSAEHPVLFVGQSNLLAITMDYAGLVEDFPAWRERHQNFWQVLIVGEEAKKTPKYDDWRVNELSSFAPGEATVGYQLLRYTKDEAAQ